MFLRRTLLLAMPILAPLGLVRRPPTLVSQQNGLITPPALAAHGLSNWEVAFFDDFISNTICPGFRKTFQVGCNWYWDQCINSTRDYAISPTLTAATIPTTLRINGSVIPQDNDGGGQNASPHGGILTFLLQPGSLGGSPIPYNGCIATVPYNDNNLSVFRNSRGTFGHSYIEAYIQFNPAVESVPPPGRADSPKFSRWGWPAWWATGAPHPISGDYTEIDFMEYFGSAFQPAGTRATTFQTSVIDWRQPNITGRNGHGRMTIDANWHTYGCLWISTGLDRGKLTFYFDNIAYSSIRTGKFARPAEGGAYLEANPSLILRLGSGNQWPMNVDWVRVWQAKR